MCLEADRASTNHMRTFVPYPNFVGGSYTSRSPLVGIERTLNFYPEFTESPGAKTQSVLYCRPGMERFGSAAAENPTRAIYNAQGRLFRIAGGLLGELTAAGVTTERGTVANDAQPAQMTDNGPNGGQMFVVSARSGYVYDLATNTGPTLVVSDVDFCAFMDGFVVALDAETSTLKASNLLDASVWPADMIARRNIAQDPWVSMVVNNREIWLFGTRTTDIYYNNGGAPYPFGPVDGASVPYGIVAPWSAAIVAGRIMWLSQAASGSGVVLMSEGRDARPASDQAVEYAIQTYGDISDAVGWSYKLFGHEFYILEFPSAGKTWAYDTRTGIWCEVATHDETTGQELPWKARWHVWLYDKHIVGDRATGQLFTLNPDRMFDDDTLIRRVRRAPHIVSSLNRVRYDGLRLDIQTGLGLSTGQGEDPQVMMRYSDDGGRTWGNERWKSAGKIGEYKRLVEWSRLGTARQRVFEVTFSDPVPWAVMNAYISAEQLRS